MEGEQVLINLILPKSRKTSIVVLRNIILILSFSLLTALSAKLKFEIGAVPITGQTFAVILSGILLGSLNGSLSQLIYLFAGLAGFPIFARGGGIQYILSPTFGYIIGFVFAAFFVGKLAEKGWDRSFKTSILTMIIGNLIIYFFGLMWLIKFVPLASLLKVGFFPFLLGDVIKDLIIGVTLPFSWKAIKSFKSHD